LEITLSYYFLLTSRVDCSVLSAFIFVLRLSLSIT
jgi:hypothetical protein